MLFQNLSASMNFQGLVLDYFYITESKSVAMDWLACPCVTVLEARVLLFSMFNSNQNSPG